MLSFLLLRINQKTGINKTMIREDV